MNVCLRAHFSFSGPLLQGLLGDRRQVKLLSFLLLSVIPLTSSCSGTNGLGKETILALAKHSPEHIYFTGRNSDSGKSIISDVKAAASSPKLTFIECNQLSLASVKNAAKEFLSASSRLDVLICNAGVMATGPALTEDGYENQVGINHVAHALLVKLLLPILHKTANKTGDIRILFLTSLGFM